ncbi:AbiTii domain-containing protein [Burkholderia vietnamiensis]|uniref:AbiTii domain-containing protein n=1 Tax=Burkholderia vietnamiensis TaxID=60552 RepID=UPI001CF35F68|nr:hypothetical protein [Burkholderia vietnamiensis]MCA8285743.1 hypothetical protein [Burkholderia vietnamiensis]
MQLFDDIVNLLSDDKGSLASALLKTKVLMHRIGHRDLDNWLNSELNGYTSNAQIPDYRIVGMQLVGTVETVAWRRRGVTLPIFHLKDNIRERLCRAHLGHSVAELEEMATAEEGTLGSVVPPELYGMLSEPYDGAHVTSARSLIGTTQIAGVLVEIRSRLLEFVLNLQDKVGDIPEKDLKTAAKGINTQEMFNSAVFGANATIIVGNQNTATITNNVDKGDFNKLKAILQDAGIGSGDVQALNQAIQEDRDAPEQTKAFGPKVAAWIGSMIQKAATGGWNVGVGAAGNLLASAISSYYGIDAG